MPRQVRESITAEELYASPQRDRSELIRGAIAVREPPGGAHGRIAALLAHLLHAHVERHGLGTVLVETGYVLARNPDTVRGPDVSFISTKRLTPERLPEGFIPGAPDLAIEVLSPDDRAADVEDKVRDYLAAGTSLVWIVDPRNERIVVRAPGAEAGTLAAGSYLDGGAVVPGFRCAVAEVFGAG